MSGAFDPKTLAAMSPAARSTFLSVPGNLERAMASLQSGMGGLSPQEMLQLASAFDDDPDCTDEMGNMFCDKHKREVCQVCCTDHRVTNQLRGFRGPGAAQAAREAALRAEYHAEMDGFKAWIRARGVSRLEMGNQRAQDLFDEYTGGRYAGARAVGATKQVVLGAEPPGVSACAVCAAPRAQAGGPLLLCTRCRDTTYCSPACQKKAWPSHKPACTEKARLMASTKALAESLAAPAGSR